MLPSKYAEKLGICDTKLELPKHKEDNGQFFTPPPIAH